MTESWSRRLFSEMVARPDEAVDLAEASLLIACEEYPDLDVPGYLSRLDAMAVLLRNRVGEGADPSDLVAALRRYLFEEEGFKGNSQEYYDPRNSFLNDVLDRKVGIPITLSTLYMEIARRAGLPVHGVGLPGHFIVRVELPGGGLLVDPFHGGEPLTARDCQKRLDRIYGGKVALESRMLASCGRKHILARTLRNLKAIYLKAEDRSRALGIVSLLLRLDPQSPEDLRDRGLLHDALDCYALAASDLEAYLTLVPSAHEAEKLRERITDLRRRAARLN
ncbi:MAG TPA: tetratricopeptide repeat protein [Vicinamibacteria bacterium]|nr:tetratricopeptide repeat protein [Vicinamibacteria bacterium]